MVVMIESLIGILIIHNPDCVADAEKSPCLSGRLSPAIREKCMELGLIEKREQRFPGQISFRKESPCLLLCSSSLLS